MADNNSKSTMNQKQQMRTKPVEAAPTPENGNNGGIVSLLSKVSSKRKKREQFKKEAKEQEARYVKHRKEEILANTRLTHRGNLGVSYLKTPSLKNAQFIDTDDKFPAPKMGIGMDFGVYKAHLLNKKPNPKYATWSGKQSKEGHYIGLDILEYLGNFKAKEKLSQNRPQIDPEKDLEGVKHGNFEELPLDDTGSPIWTTERDDDEDTERNEDDTCVNFETIEQAILNPQMLEFPKSEQKHTWYEDFDKLMKQSKEKDEIIKNTLRTVINLSMHTQSIKIVAEDEKRPPIVWKENIVEYTYNREDVPCNIQLKKEKKMLKNNVRGEKKQKKKKS